MKNLVAVITAIAVAMVITACGREAPKQPEVKMQMTAPVQPAKPTGQQPTTTQTQTKTENPGTGATSQE